MSALARMSFSQLEKKKLLFQEQKIWSRLNEERERRC